MLRRTQTALPNKSEEVKLPRASTFRRNLPKRLGRIGCRTGGNDESSPSMWVFVLSALIALLAIVSTFTPIQSRQLIRLIAFTMGCK
jgi:hypothetical protein